MAAKRKKVKEIKEEEAMAKEPEVKVEVTKETKPEKAPEPAKVEPKKEKVKAKPKSMEFSQAYRIYKKNNKKIEWWDAEAVKVFASRKIGVKSATYAEWCKVFEKY